MTQSSNQAPAGFTLLREDAYINGAWAQAESGSRFAVINPASGETLANVPDMNRADTCRAINAANNAWPEWRARTAKERAGFLRRWFELIMEHQEALARLMTAEQGKPLKEARGEVAYGASFIEWFSEEAKRAYGDVIPGHGPDKRIMVIKQPIGVVAAITPWNFPIAMMTRKVGPALAAGCTVVVKPAEDTPLCALALAELAKQAGIPPGVINVVTCSKAKAPEVGMELTTHPEVRKVTFTGSTPVGKQLMSQASGTVKKVSLELGGNAPFIVFDDADLDAAVAGLMASKYRNTGQTCVCANRVYVQSGVYQAFSEKLADAVAKLVVGAGLDGDTDQGPLINQAALDKVKAHVQDATDKGASILCGGDTLASADITGCFYAPTILTDVTQDMLIAKAETFGPVAPLFRFETESEAISMANDTEFGLAAYFYSNNVQRIGRVAEALETGIVGINDGIISTEVAPFGGIKESGLGREGSHYGLDEFMELKYLCMGGMG